MRRRLGWATAAALVLSACLAAAGPRLPRGIAPPAAPADNPMSVAKVELGRRLFYDADLSINGTLSCATCHEQRRGFTGGDRTHPGVLGDPGRRNVMPLANVGYFTVFTWGDPRRRSLEDQALVPITGEHPVEMGMAGHEAAITERLASDRCYPKAFAAAFPETKGAITLAVVVKAIAAFERTLVSYDAAYDRYLRGDRRALSAEARHGETLFYGAKMGCVSCHAGARFTDADRKDALASFHRLPGGAPSPSDAGLGEITGRREDDGRFRTPSLRNLMLSGPYLHDGSTASLEAAIQAHFPAGRGPNAAELRALTAFLDALTDRSFAADPRFSAPDLRTCPTG
jgi:cytochrome c peroxidase